MKEDNNSPSKNRELTLEDIQDLSLMDNDFFLFAADDNKELADVLIKPALKRLGITNYEIVSVKSEVSYINLKNHSVRIDCVVKLESGEIILIEIQNGHPEEMPLKRVRLENSSVDTKSLKPGEPYTHLPDIISLIYTTEPLKYHDTGKTVNQLAVVDLDNGEIAFDYGIRIFIVNGKYKDEESKEFSDLIEDLQKRNSEDIKNPVIKNIHDKTKKTEKGQTMLSEFIEERYGTVIRDYEEQHKRDQEQHLKDQEQHLRDQEEIQKYKQMLLDNGIIVD